MGIEFPRLRELDTMGEVSDHEVRECFEKSLGIPVVDLYSAREVNVIALQCPENPHYHVQSEAILVEVLDDNGQPCAPGPNRPGCCHAIAQFRDPPNPIRDRRFC